MPPREHLGWFTTPGECDAIADWLRECPADRYVISADMLCYGGLVASRTPEVEVGGALRRLEVLRELRRRRPGAIIFGFSIVMRLGATVTDVRSLALHQALGSYSQLVDRVERLGETDLRPQLNAVASQLEPDALANYLALRRRNHAVNSAAVKLVAEGILDHLILAQEDSAPVGIHIPELLALRAQVDEFRAADRVAIHAGADEVGLVLMARHHLSAGAPARVGVEYASPEGAAAMPQFEHQPISQTVESQLRAAGARMATQHEADALLVVHTPIGAQADIAETPPPGHSPALAAQARAVAERTRAASADGLPVGLADAAYCNGADPELIAALKGGGAGHLAAYAGWNTAGNTLGAVISQLCITASSHETDSGPGLAGSANQAARDFIACRFIDDYGYQSCVRRSAAERAAATGANPFALGGDAPRMERLVQHELEPFAHQAYSDLLGAPSELAERVEVSLPWQRLFEVEVRMGAGGCEKGSVKNR